MYIVQPPEAMSTSETNGLPQLLLVPFLWYRTIYIHAAYAVACRLFMTRLIYVFFCKKCWSHGYFYSTYSQFAPHLIYEYINNFKDKLVFAWECFDLWVSCSSTSSVLAQYMKHEMVFGQIWTRIVDLRRWNWLYTYVMSWLILKLWPDSIVIRQQLGTLIALLIWLYSTRYR